MSLSNEIRWINLKVECLFIKLSYVHFIFWYISARWESSEVKLSKFEYIKQRKVKWNNPHLKISDKFFAESTESYHTSWWTSCQQLCKQFPSCTLLPEFHSSPKRICFWGFLLTLAKSTVTQSSTSALWRWWYARHIDGTWGTPSQRGSSKVEKVTSPNFLPWFLSSLMSAWNRLFRILGCSLEKCQK